MTLKGDAAQGGERSQRSETAAVIERRREDIEARWLATLEAGLEDRKVDRTELRDSIDEYLHRIAGMLRGSEEMEQGGGGVWADVSRVHAENRLRLGFDIEKLFHDFIVLRQVLVQVAEEEGIKDAWRQVSRLADLVDGAIGEAVKYYVQSRDYAARRTEAEHIGFITHELRNPLQTAMFAAAQLRRQGASAAPGRALDVLDTNHRRLEYLIDQVLRTERLEAGAEEARLVDTTLGEVLGDALDLGRYAAAAKGIAFHAEVDFSIRLQADLRLSASAMQNLIDNAVKFTDQGSVEVSAEEGATCVTLHVRDTCPGLPDEEIRRIFEPFHRVHVNKEGTGLGLAITRRAVEAQGGTIHAESSRGGGCHFWLTLPRPKGG